MTKTFIYRNSKIKSYERERPTAYHGEPDYAYHSRLNRWQSSKKEYSFAEGQERLLRKHLISKDGCIKDVETNVTGLVEIKLAQEIGNEFGSIYYAFFLSPDKEERQLQDIAESIQSECHRTVEYVKDNSNNFSYPDATNVFIFRKLAELQLEINKLKRK